VHAAARQPAEGQAAAGEASGAQQPKDSTQKDYQPGLYYRDAYRQLQGPFTLEQLRGWRGMLSMDLPILCYDPDNSKNGGHAQPSSRDGGKQDGSMDTSGAAQHASNGSRGSVRCEQAAPGGEPGEGAGWSRAPLAELLGDEELLERWRLENPDQAGAAAGCAASRAQPLTASR
jgi:hypothetical protein